jgi:hypothetical protein
MDDQSRGIHAVGSMHDTDVRVFVVRTLRGNRTGGKYDYEYPHSMDRSGLVCVTSMALVKPWREGTSTAPRRRNKAVLCGVPAATRERGAGVCAVLAVLGDHGETTDHALRARTKGQGPWLVTVMCVLIYRHDSHCLNHLGTLAYVHPKAP